MNGSVSLDYDGFNIGKKIYVKNWYQHYIALKQNISKICIPMVFYSFTLKLYKTSLLFIVSPSHKIIIQGKLSNPVYIV